MYTAPKPNSKIIIVGAGCFGLSTAYALSKDKAKEYDIWVFDRGESIPISDAASTDISKAVRMDYGNNTLYMHLAVEAIDAWKQWNAERAEKKLVPVYHNTGMLIFSANGQYAEYEKDNMRSIREAGFGDYIEELNADQLKERYPYLTDTVDNGYDIAYANKVGGWCNSSESIKHLYGECIQNGVKFVLGNEAGRFEKLQVDGRHVRGIITADKKEHTADRVIVAAGSWTPSVIDMHRQAIATGQYVIHFSLSKEDQERMATFPVWSADVSNTGFYGFPCNENGILKIAKHSTGYLNPSSVLNQKISVPRTQSTNPNDTIPKSALAEARAFLKKFLPFTDALDVVYSRVCWYSDSIDGDFIIAPHPDYDHLIVATGDSGHAMKFLPVIGDKIRDIVEDTDSQYKQAWAWKKKEAPKGFYDRPLLVKEGDQDIRMATMDELRAYNKD
ncbi:fructosyl amino acid oxidase [Mucor ambiguus]|uniref:Fructosyl amino acid oxidase n=1 Tax=Mucor ambiguus TaxID=91626 RepID=A0A0C9LRU9_9FUNG|nr:fructosyl amino acid oxidase [Mucor ambiguus]